MLLTFPVPLSSVCATLTNEIVKLSCSPASCPCRYRRLTLANLSLHFPPQHPLAPPPSPVFAFLRFCFLIYIYILFLQKFTQID